MRAVEVQTMGTALPPLSQFIEAKYRRWTPCNRSLPKEGQTTFDRLFDRAKLHIQTGGMGSRPSPFETVVMAVLLTPENRI
jgi:hypothetical protein